MKVKIKGIGQLNGPVMIDKELDLDDSIARSLIGSKKNEILTALINQYYPGVVVKPNQINVNLLPNEKSEKSTSTKSDEKLNIIKGAAAGAILSSNKSSNRKKSNNTQNQKKDFSYLILPLADIQFEDEKELIKKDLKHIYKSIVKYNWALVPCYTEIEKVNNKALNSVLDKYKEGFNLLLKNNDVLPKELKWLKFKLNILRTKKILGMFSIYLMITVLLIFAVIVS